MKFEIDRWRIAEERDLPKLQEIYQAQCERVGKQLDWFHPLKPPSLCCIVGEINGEVVGAIGGEMVAELFVIAREPRFAREAFRKVGAPLASHFRLRKIRTVRCFVHKGFERSIGWLLKKFGFDGPMKEYAHYYLDLAQPEPKAGDASCQPSRLGANALDA